MATAALPALGGAADADRYKYKYIIAITVSLASVLELLDTSIVNVAIPHMMGNLGATLDEIAWVSTGYIVANVIILPITGWLSAYFGRRRYFAGSIALFVLSSFFCGNAHTLTELVIARIVQGLGGGALLSTSQAILYEEFPREEFGTAMAIFGVGVMVGPTLGPTLGGYITDAFGWPWIFYINIPIGMLALALSLSFIQNSRFQQKAERVDYIGLLLLATGIGTLQVMLERGERLDWFDSREVTTYAVITVLPLVALLWPALDPGRRVDLRSIDVEARALHDRQRNGRLLLAADFPRCGAGADLRPAHEPGPGRPADEQDPERHRALQPDAAARRQRGDRHFGHPGAAVYVDPPRRPDRQRDPIQPAGTRAAERNRGAAHRDGHTGAARRREGAGDPGRPGHA